jgi:aminopeptidase
MPDSAFMNTEDVHPDLVAGAQNAIHTCLAVTPADRAVMITDLPTLKIAAAIWAELQQSGAEASCFVLEEHGQRPLDVVPSAILRSLESATVSLMVVQPQPGELKTRTEIMDIVRARGVRHAHMPGIDERMMMTGMRADYHRVARTQDRLLERLGPDSVVRLTNPAGTELEVRFSPDHRWVRCDGLIKAGVLQNLPTGQLYTTPSTVEGVFVGDGAIGEWFALKYNEIEKYPLTVEIAQGRVLDARSSNATLARQFLLYIRSNPGGDRVGEFAIGTNLALTEFLGNALQDENVPGAHLAFGGAAILASTGARWSSKTHLPLIARDCDIDIDGAPVMRGGKFEPKFLQG